MAGTMVDLVIDIDTDDPDDRPNCVGKSPRIFYPDTTEELREAFSICYECPIKVKCYSWAVVHKETGVWGGKLFSRGVELKLRAREGPGRLNKDVYDLPFELRPISETSFQIARQRMN